MRLSREMIEAMGGSNSEHYIQFVSHMCEGFNILRKNANMIINMVLLMSDANIPDVGEPNVVVLKLMDRFRLDLSDEDAVQHMQAVIAESVGAFFPAVFEAVHRVAQMWRS